MKKNVKYIGSAIAVALLAAGAPVVIPMMIPVNIVQARDQPIDDNNTSEQPDSPLVDKINQFYGQFGKHIYVSGPNSLKDVLNTLSTNDYTENYYYFDPSSPKHIHDLQSDTALAKLKTNPILGQKENFGDAIFENNNGDYYYRDVLGYFSFHDASTDKDIDVSSSSKMQDYLNSLATAQWPFTVTIHLVQSTDKSDGTYKTPSLSNIDASLKSYSFEVDRSSLNIQKDTTTPVIAKGTKVITEDGLNSKLASGNNSLSVVDNYSKNSGNEYQSDMDRMAQPYYGSSFFANETDAIDYAKTPEFDTASVSAPKSVSLSDKGTYYQTVSYFLKGNSDSAVQAMLENSTDDKTGGKLDDYQTFINGKLGTDGTDYVLNKSAGYLTVVRAIQVGDGMTANLTDIQTTVGNDILSKENIGSLQYNGKIIPSTSTTDGKYYIDPQGKEEAPTEDISAGKFNKPGHYYRKITYTLNSGKASDYGIEVAPGSPDNTVTFMQKVNVEQIDKVVNPVSVTKGDSSTADTVTGVVTEYGINSNLLLTDDGSLVDTTKGQYKGVSFGTGYYLDDGKTTDSDVLNNKVKPVADVVDDNGNFAKSGDYLRTITFYLIDSTIDTDSLSELGSCKVGKDAEGNNTVTYIQKVHIAGYPVVKVVLSDDLSIPIYKQVIYYPQILINDTDSNGSYSAYLTVGSDNHKLTDPYYAEIGEHVYHSSKDALTNNNPVKSILFEAEKTEPEFFKQVGCYYRTVSFQLGKSANLYNFEDESGKRLEEGTDYTFNADKNIITFAQVIHVTGSTATATMPDKVSVSYSKNLNTFNIDPGAKLTDDANGNTIATGTVYSLYTTAEAAYNSDSSKAVYPLKPGVYYTEVSLSIDSSKYDLYTNNEGEKINGYLPKIEGNTISYIQQVTIEPEEVKTEINSQTADVGTDMNDFIENNFGTYELHGTNNQEDAVGTGIPIFSINGQSINFSYYSNPTDALNQSNPVSETKFAKGKTYYLPIKFQLEKGDSVKNYNFEDTNKLGIKVDENSNSVIYVLEIDVVDNSVTTTIPSITIPWGTNRENVDNNKDGIDFKVNASGESVVNQDDLIFPTDENNNILYFSSRDKALAAINSGDSEPYELSNNKFSTPGTYYRIGGFIDKSDHDYNNENVIEKPNEDGSNTVLFLQEIDVTPHPAKIGIDSLSVDVGTSLNSDVMKNKDSYTLTDEDNNSLGTASIIGTDYYKTASDALNNQNNDDSVALTNDELNKGKYYRIITFKPTSGDFAQYYSFDTNTNKNVRFNDDGTISYAQQVLVDSNSVVAESISVTTGTTTSDSKLTSTDDYGLKDKTKKDIEATVTVDSDNYYTSFDTALANDKSGLANVKDRFTTPGTYYRLITFTPTVKLDKDSFDDPQVSVNDDGTVTYAQEIDVTAKKNSGGTTGSHSGSSTHTGNNTGTEDEWTYYQDAGVVTTKTTEPTYSLNNHANETIQNRALSENSSWVTDQYRVNNRTGVKQYRVATGEWIDANDVYFRDNGNDAEDEWTYYKDPGVVLTKETQEYYSLNNHANETIQNRALSEDSGWITDQYRVNNRTGVKQYRVATGEWIDSHDVIFVKDVQMIVNVDETKDYYNLYDIQKNTNSNRALEKKTSWLSDKVAIDYDGSTYYRVATNEWVKQENGVHLDTSVWYKN